jgi:CheY-like chemotaxis protein
VTDPGSYAADESVRPSDQDRTRRGEDVLVADDDPTSRRVVAFMLEQSGYRIIDAADGTAAWDVLRRPDAPGIVILDWLMPGLDGIEVLRKVRGHAFMTLQPYVLMVTSQARKEDVLAGLDAGANDYITKPFDLAELRARVEVGRRMQEVQRLLLEKNVALRKALNEIKTLRGIIPICANCKSIRDDAGYWKDVEVYLQQYCDAAFSHGICPNCMQKLYPGVPVSKGAKNTNQA